MANESNGGYSRDDDAFPRIQPAAPRQNNKIDARLRRVDGLAGSEPKRLAADAKKLAESNN